MIWNSSKMRNSFRLVATRAISAWFSHQKNAPSYGIRCVSRTQHMTCMCNYFRSTNVCTKPMCILVKGRRFIRNIDASFHIISWQMGFRQSPTIKSNRGLCMAHRSFREVSLHTAVAILSKYTESWILIKKYFRYWKHKVCPTTKRWGAYANSIRKIFFLESQKPWREWPT